MNDYLKAAVSRDKRKKQYLISPISKNDAEIIWEIIVALSKLNDTEDIRGIIEEWKFLKDSEIKDLLLQWNIDHPIGFNNKENTGRRFVQFEDEIIELSLIRSVTKFNHYNYSRKITEYRIVINKDFPDSCYLNNFHFSYQTEELRDKKLKHLKRILGKEIKIV